MGYWRIEVMETEPKRETVREAVEKAFPNNPEVLEEMQWDCIMGCWTVWKWNMMLGIETDGYVHS
jgi:hypothetical protein